MHALKTYSELKQLFMKKVVNHYSFREQEQLFFWVLYHLTKWSKVDFSMHRNNLVKEHYFERCLSIIEQLNLGKPIQHILGFTSFYELDLKVNNNTLIPRPETEELVSYVLEDINPKDVFNVIDIGTGSGCIALALKQQREFINIIGVDVSDKALEVAKFNAEKLKLDIRYIMDDITRPNKKYPQLDYVISNPPYIPQSELNSISTVVRNHEPHLALFVHDNDPLFFYKSILAFCHLKLKNRGKIFFEIHEDFGDEMVNLISDNHYSNIELKKDLQGKNRFIKAIKFE